ncbi:MAG TPA: hypothetical protein VF796_16155, partial [Humisphaera sp.]
MRRRVTILGSFALLALAAGAAAVWIHHRPARCLARLSTVTSAADERQAMDDLWSAARTSGRPIRFTARDAAGTVV